MDKKKLINQLCVQLEQDLQALKEAAIATYQAATDEENKPENEYDTRGLEASYLAGAQAKRVADVEEQLFMYKHLEIKQFTKDTPIAVTALVEVEMNEKRSLVFIVPKGGGLFLKFEDKALQIITPSSPLGEALVGLKVGETAVIDVGETIKEYDVISVQ